MEFIAIDKTGVELGLLRNLRGMDVDIGGSNDFVLTFDASAWDGVLSKAFYWYAYGPGMGEVGGQLLSIKSSTADGQLQAAGFTWRGMLQKKILEPPPGENYLIVSGEANTVLRQLIESRFDGLFSVPKENSGIVISSHKFSRYENLLDGIVKMLAIYKARLEIEYHPGVFKGHTYTPGVVQIRTVPIIDYSTEIEFSQDGRIDFIAQDSHMGINHLICLGQGDLAARQVVHLYMDKEGKISREQTQFGVDERAEAYDYSNAESEEDLIKNGMERLRDRGDFKRLKINLSEIPAALGDIVGGQEQITGITLKKQITKIIFKVDKQGKLTITHKVGD